MPQSANDEMSTPSRDTGSSLRPPIAIALGVFAAFEALHVVLAWDGARLIVIAVPRIGIWLGPLLWGIYTVAALAVVAVLRSWERIGLVRPPVGGSIRLAWAPLTAGLPFLAFGVNVEPDAVGPLLLLGTPLIALNEEIMFRGVLLDLLRPLGWRRAVTGSAILFGLSHLTNLVAGASPPLTVMQVAATTAGGVALAAIRIRTGSLWPVIAIHVGLDLVAIATLTGPAVGSPWLLPILFTWLGANLLLWRYGWGLLSGLSEIQLDSAADRGALPLEPSPA